MMHTRNSQHGFTFVEIVVVMALLFIVATFTSIVFQNMYAAAALRATSEEVYTSLVDARTRTLASENDTVSGVRVGTSSVTRFVGPAYDPTDTRNQTFIYEGGVTATGTLVTSETDIVFTRLTGGASATGVIYVVNREGDATTTVTIHASGLVE